MPFRFSLQIVPTEHRCRSTSAKPADRRSLNRRTLKAHRQQSESSRLKTSYIYMYIYLNIFNEICRKKRHAVVTYQPHAHICNSFNRYVVVTYRSIFITQYKKHVSYTCNSSVLTQIGTEQLRNRQIITFLLHCFLYH